MKNILLKLIFLFWMVCSTVSVSWGNDLEIIPDEKEEMLLVEAISRISQEYGVYFTFDHELVKDIVVEYETRTDLTVEEAISGVLAGTDLKFKLYDQRFVILYQNDEKGLESLKEMIKHFEHIIADGPEKKAARRNLKPVTTIPLRDSWLPPVRQLSQPAINVSGTVTDQEGEALIGVNVQVKGTTKGTATDFDGKYVLEDIDENAVLVFSYIGYQTQEILVDGQSVIDVVLETDSQTLEQVVVVAYGEQTKESVIGAITTISTEDLKVPVSKLSNSLAGQLAGIVSVQGSGEPGSGSNFWIRGVSTFGANNAPLILVDGVERPLDLVDPEDVASFSILKDATATAVYGVRGANGIVLITTKRGKDLEKPVINGKVEYGILSPVRMVELADAEQWMNYYNDISFDASNSIPFPDHIKQKYLSGEDPDLYPNVDWIDALFKPSTSSQRANLNVTGGGKVMQYFISGSYYNENGIFNPIVTKQYNPSMNYDKFSFRSNLDVSVSPTTQVSLSLSNQYETKNRLGVAVGTMYERMLTTPPIATPTEYSDGTHAQPLVGYNPYYALNSTGFSQDFWNNSQALVGLKQDLSSLIIPGLEFNFRFSWDAFNGSTLDKRKSPATYYATGRDEK